ncbi:hypothetical protein J4479_03475 [Candidatus Woesearchaeota archaeon]|nr:hypothetical protein [Candidatus Woesearchaeota archaeon]
MEKPKLMIEQLIEHYENYLNLGNGGHVVCYFNERRDENVRTIYEFPRGIFSLRNLSGRAIHWNYDPKQQ